MEDEPLIAVAEQVSLERLGYSVVIADTGKRAIEMVRANPGIDLVLMDIDLGPGIDGVEAAARVLEVRDLPVVFLWSDTQPAAVARAETIASYGYVAKNTTATVLDATIKVALRLFSATHRDSRLEDGTGIGIGIDVTADKTAMQRLKAHEERFESMLEQHHAVMLLIEPKSGRIRGANRSAVRFYGYSREELLRMAIQDINTMPPEKVAELRALAEREKLSHFVFSHRLANGETRTVEVHSSPIPTEEGILLFSIIHDITNRQRVEEALQQSEAEFRKIFEIATVGIVQVNPAIGRVLRCNERYQTITGYTESELLELSFPELTHPEDRERDWKVFSTAARGETPSYYSEKRYVRKDGRIIWVRLNANFVRDARGNPIRSVAVCEDITESRSAQERIRQLFAEKEILLKEVQHRVKNTMHTMGSLLDLEANRLSDPGAVAAMNDMQSRFKSMEVLYDHLYRTESHEVASVSDYLTSLVRSVADLFSRRDAVRITTDIDDISLDAKRLSALGMVVNELVTNALKYAFRERDHGTLEITGKAQGERIIVTVADDGPGLPDSFDPGTEESFGLTMVRALTDQLHGTVRFERAGGTRVVVEFGLRQDEV